MGRAARARPKHLAMKLALIRKILGLSQNELIVQMELEGALSQRDISAYELGKREPGLIMLLKIARVAGGKKGTGKYLELLLDDNLKLNLSDLRKKGASKRRATT